MKSRFSIVLLLLLTACVDNSSDAGPRALLGFREPGEACQNGGVLLVIGEDEDGDGILDESEITDSRPVCNGDDGRVSLLRVEDVPAGDSCDMGGRVVHVGIDDDGDGILDTDEIDSSTYLCDPRPGSAGSAGLINMQKLINVVSPVVVAFPKPYPDQPPELVYVDLVLAEDYTDPTGSVSLPAGAQLKVNMGEVTTSGFQATAITPDGKPMVNPRVNLFYAAFEFAD